MPELTLDRVTKYFHYKKVVDTLSMSFQNGVYGVLGENGSGKTTLFRMICDILKPDAGSICCNGIPIHQMGAAYRKILGYLPQEFGYYPRYTAYRYMEYLAALKAVPREETEEKIRTLLELTGLSSYQNQELHTFSGGMLKRLGIAQALLNDPSILVLDEPTAGLDLKERIHLRNIVQTFAKDRIVLISTHIVSDVEYIADRVLIMKGGKAEAAGSIAELAKQVDGAVWEFSVPKDALEAVQEKYMVSHMREEGGATVVRAIAKSCPGAEAVLVQPNLSDIYLYYFRES